MHLYRIGLLACVLIRLSSAGVLADEIVLSTSQPAASQPAKVQVPIETLRRSFASTYRQAQTVEAADTVRGHEQALGHYRQLQKLIDKHPDVTDPATKKVVASKPAMLQERLVELRKKEAEEQQQERERRAVKAPARPTVQPTIVGGVPLANGQSIQQNDDQQKSNQKSNKKPR